MKSFFFNLKTTFFRLWEWLYIALCDYPKRPLFVLIDLLLTWQYLWKNPHRISKAFLKKRGETNVYAYGETPLRTLNHIATECRILSHDRFYELGCGSGRGCFWLHQFIKCRVVGIDYVPSFIQKATKVKKALRLTGVNFLLQDMCAADLKEASAIYLYGTCLDHQTIEELILKFRNLKQGVKVITVSYPLTEYCDFFTLEKQFLARYPWGRAHVFLNIRN